MSDRQEAAYHSRAQRIVLSRRERPGGRRRMEPGSSPLINSQEESFRRSRPSLTVRHRRVGPSKHAKLSGILDTVMIFGSILSSRPASTWLARFKTFAGSPCNPGDDHGKEAKGRDMKRCSRKMGVATWRSVSCGCRGHMGITIRIPLVRS